MNLTGTQLQDTYGNVVTVGESAGTPTTGTIQNGAGSDITNLTVNGTVTANLTGDVTGNVTGDLTGNVSGATTIAGTTVNATTVNATTITGSGEDISELPLYQLRWTNGVPAYFAFTNGAKNYIPWNQKQNNLGFNEYFQLYNQGVGGAGTASTCTRVQIKEAGYYIIAVGIHTFDMNNHNYVTVDLEKTSTLTGTMSRFRTLISDEFNVQSNGTAITIHTSRLFYASNANDYWSISMTPSKNSPIMADGIPQTYFHLTKISDY